MWCCLLASSTSAKEPAWLENCGSKVAFHSTRSGHVTLCSDETSIPSSPPPLTSSLTVHLAPQNIAAFDFHNTPFSLHLPSTSLPTRVHVFGCNNYLTRYSAIFLHPRFSHLVRPPSPADDAHRRWTTSSAPHPFIQSTLQLEGGRCSSRQGAFAAAPPPVSPSQVVEVWKIPTDMEPSAPTGLMVPG